MPHHHLSYSAFTTQHGSVFNVRCNPRWATSAPQLPWLIQIFQNSVLQILCPVNAGDDRYWQQLEVTR